MRENPATTAAMAAFRLPWGLRDAAGSVHRDGWLRPATAWEEARALQDFRSQLRPGGFLDVILARTVVRLGTLERVDPGDVERLDPEDRRHLEDVYRRLNGYATMPEEGQ